MAEKERETREVAPYRRRGPLSVFEDMERMFERFMPEWPRAGFWGAPGFPDVDIFEGQPGGRQGGAAGCEEGRAEC
jgi:hypothetical protein